MPELSPPIPWSAVPDGAVVLLDDRPCRILAVCPATWPGALVIYPECSAPRYVTADDTTYLVQLNETDAIGNLFAAGLNPEVLS